MQSSSISSLVESALYDNKIESLKIAISIFEKISINIDYNQKDYNNDAELIIDSLIKYKNKNFSIITKQKDYLVSTKYVLYSDCVTKILDIIRNSNYIYKDFYNRNKNHFAILIFTRFRNSNRLDSNANNTIEEMLDSVFQNFEYDKLFSKLKKVNDELGQKLIDKENEVNEMIKLIKKEYDHLLKQKLTIEKDLNHYKSLYEEMLKEKLNLKKEYDLLFLDLKKQSNEIISLQKVEELNLQIDKNKNTITLLEKQIMILNQKLNECIENTHKNKLYSSNVVNENQNKETNKATLIQEITKKNLDIKDINKVKDFGFLGLRYEIDGAFYKIVVNIADLWSNDQRDYHKYHIFECKTLTEMRENKHIKNYSISSRIDNKFFYRIHTNNKIIEKNDQELFICKNCLEIYNNYITTINKRIINPNEFNKNNLLSDFISNDFIKINNDQVIKLNSDFLYDFESIPNRYSDDWKNVSMRLKIKNNYECNNCNWKPPNDKQKRFIHVHHLNYQKFDNNENNLKVLCIECHSNQDLHQHIQNSSDYIEFIKLKNN
jgi:hypothetical protein